MAHRRWKIIACLFLIVATLATYSDLINHQFINYDDDIYVTDNPPVQRGLTFEGVSWAFTTMHSGNWHPLTWLSHMLDCQLFGLNPGEHHLTNVVLHVANSLLLFLWFLYVTRTLGCSFLVAALFALHPMHVQSVAWVAERKDVLSTCFWLLTMWAYVWYVESPRLRRYVLILVCFSLGLMAKPMLVTLPVILLLLDYWPLGRLSLQGSATAGAASQSGSRVANQRLVYEKLPLLALSALSSVVTVYAQKEAGALWTFQTLPFANRLANALVAYVSYLGKMFWPTRLAIFYPLPQHHLPIWQAPAAGLILVVLSLLALRLARRHPYLLVGWLWYLCTLLPVIGLVQVGGQAMADRYTYVPFIGLFIVLVWGMADLGTRWQAPPFLLPLGAGVVLAALMICTWVQVRYWHDSLTLYEHALEVTRGNPLIHNNLGIALAAQGKPEEAEAHYAEALRLDPNFALTHNNLGMALAKRGKLEEAEAYYAEALRLNPKLAEAHNNLGIALAKQGKLEEAETQYAEALRLNPNLARAHNNLGMALAKQGKLEEAEAQYVEALRLDPHFAGAHNNLGMALVARGKLEEAEAQYAAALRLNSHFPEAYNNLGVALAKQGKIDEAIAMFQKAIQIKPDYSRAYSNLGLVFAKQGNIAKATILFQNALKFDPHNTLAQKMLDILKSQSPPH